jgi:hypothetical protein
MRSPSIERLHSTFNRHIKLVEAYTEIEGLAFIIKACRLKPYDYVFKNRDSKLILIRDWFDEFGNSFTIDHKKINITYNDLKLNRDLIVSTDIYYGLSLENIVKISKLVYLVAGKDEDLLQECYILTFLGIDDHLRSYLYWYGSWQQVSPLIIGMKSLTLLAKHLEIKYFHQIVKKENSPMPCVQATSWISFLPASIGFLDIIEEQYKILFPILGRS